MDDSLAAIALRGAVAFRPNRNQRTTRHRGRSPLDVRCAISSRARTRSIRQRPGRNVLLVGHSLAACSADGLRQDVKSPLALQMATSVPSSCPVELLQDLVNEMRDLEASDQIVRASWIRGPTRRQVAEQYARGVGFDAEYLSSRRDARSMVDPSLGGRHWRDLRRRGPDERTADGYARLRLNRASARLNPDVITRNSAPGRRLTSRQRRRRQASGRGASSPAPAPFTSRPAASTACG